MTHRGGRSDPGIVAVKPANKAEPSAAESVEPRTGTKGNADQQSTRQAQDWESVSQALARIRQAAKLRKKERFPRFSTTSASICSGYRSSHSRRTRHQG